MLKSQPSDSSYSPQLVMPSHAFNLHHHLAHEYEASIETTCHSVPKSNSMPPNAATAIENPTLT